MWKKNRKKTILAVAAALVILIGCATGFVLLSQASVNNSYNQVKITAGNGEELVYGSLLSVVGNEIVCTITDSKDNKNYQIPVGTPVTTKLGTVTTFAKLSKGNGVAILLDKNTDIVKSVWITE